MSAKIEIGLALSLTLISCQIVSAESSRSSPSAEQLLNGWVASSGWEQWVAMKQDVVDVETDTIIAGGRTASVGKQHYSKLRFKYSYYRDHNRFETKGDQTKETPEEGTTGPFPFVQVLGVDEKFDAGRGGVMNPGSATSWNGLVFPSDVDKWRKGWEYSGIHAHFLDGKQLAPGRVNIGLAMLANHPRLRDETEVVNGQRCYLVTAAAGPQGKLSAWIAPAEGFGAARYTLEDDNLSLQVDVFEWQHLGEWYIPISGRWTRLMKSQDGAREESDITAKRSEVNLSSDFAAMGVSFTYDVPDGTEIEMDAAPGVEYVVDNRRLLPAIDYSSLQQLNHILQEGIATTPDAIGHRGGVETAGRRRFLELFITGAALLLGMALVWRHSLIKKRCKGEDH